jgi:hypothetical protein
LSNLLHSPVASSLLVPNILLRTKHKTVAMYILVM